MAHRSTSWPRPLALLALLLTVLLETAACGGGGGSEAWSKGKPLTLDVSSAFPAGTALVEAVSGATATVDASGRVTLPTAGAGGQLLLERAGAAATPFTWQNATVYFVVTDRFSNGDTSNDGAYGRQRDGSTEVGTWHGGDWKGLTAKLPYLADLGVTAIWITPIVEQVHGWVAGGSGAYRHYGYHGYWALDFTRPDLALGEVADLQALVDAAHTLGLRVLVDVVMNHSGYATGEDLVNVLPAVFKDGTGDQFKAFTPTVGSGWNGWNNLVNYASPAWADWWGPGWVRAGLGPTTPTPLYTVCNAPGAPVCTALTSQLTSLPDFITEGTAAAGRPAFFAAKADTGFTGPLTNGDGSGYTVRQYLVKWHTDWVRQLGIDGFRCDTAKHVELPAWKALKEAGVAALAGWKAANPGKKLDDAPFWMTGEVFPHGAGKDSYYTEGGFDSLINTDYQNTLSAIFGPQGTSLETSTELERTYANMSALVSTDPTFDALSYASSHDTFLFYDGLRRDAAKMRRAGTALLLTPGGVQIFYGDESGRVPGPTGGDSTQGTRSDMNWDSIDASIHDHFRTLATFRKRHAAVGAGAHHKLTSPTGTYAFSRTRGDDAVVVVLLPEG